MSNVFFEFHSEPLRTAIESASEVIENHEQLRDRVSCDIKTLEEYLHAFAPKETFRCAFGKAFVAPDDDQLIKASLEYSGSANGEIHEEALVWKPDSKGRFRLFYELSRWNGCIEVDVPGGPLFHEDSTPMCETRPLIEMPFDVRKLMLPRLPDFVKAMAEYLAVDAGCLAEVDMEEIPF